MSTLARRGDSLMRIVWGGICLSFSLAGGWAVQTEGWAQSSPPSAVRPGPGGSASAQPNRSHADRLGPHKLYSAHCVACHDTDGRGEPVRDIMTSIPDFTKAEWHRARTNERLVRSIREGKGSHARDEEKTGRRRPYATGLAGSQIPRWSASRERRA